MFALKVPPPLLSAGKGNDTEREAFIALAFGKVSATHELAIAASAFEQQLIALKQAGHSSVRLEQIKPWLQSDTLPLPARPILLTFEEANRETMEIADPLLAALGMTALVFVDVDQLNQGNIQLVSWHQLEQLVNSGRWEIGISGCSGQDNPELTSQAALAHKLTQQRELLEHRLKVPVSAANCPRRWTSDHDNSEEVWQQALSIAYLPMGFVAAPFGANYWSDPEFGFRRIRVSRTWNPQDLLAQINTHTPRRQAFTDTFQANSSASEWMVDSGDIAVTDGNLQLFNKAGEQGALMTLGGTEKWQDADVEVRLKGQPEGQFWIALRYRTGQPFVRLGLAKGQVILQKYDGIDAFKQLASRESPTGDITLRLHVVGFHALAYLNGEALLSRPTELPEAADHGAFALAVWNEQTGDGQVASGNALVNLQQITATPLFLKGGIIAPLPGAATLAQLSQRAGDLSMLSPRYFAWLDGKPQVSGGHNSPMEIFARYHHLQLLPALAIDTPPALAEMAALTGQALAWASEPGYDGLNILLNTAQDTQKWQPFLRGLSRRMNQAGKTLAVTLLDKQGQALPRQGDDGLLWVSARPELLPATPRLLYPSAQ
ncbi:polysaccharide deacetylase family protein [Methylovulum psychrotolerans]|nr:polysaccharide deacetylase family protein [Methylovulum psychrotolerans]